MFHRPRTYLGLTGAALIPITIIIIFLFRDPTPFLAKALGRTFTLSGSVLNGYLVALTTLNQGTMNFFAPVLIVLVAGEIVAGESQEGTLRLILTRPVMRYKFLLAKLLTVCIYTMLIFVVMLIIGLGVSLLIFGEGSLFVVGLFLGNVGWFNILNSGTALTRILMVYGISFLILLTVTTFSFFLSSILKNPIAAMIFPLVVVIFLRIVSAFPFLQELKPFFFTTHMDVWINLLSPKIDWNQVFKSMSILGLHTLTFIGASLYGFHRRDILS